VLRDYLLVTRNIDPVALERGRMATVQQGWTADKTALGLMAYAAFQELATRISHRNTGRYSDDPVADKIMLRVAADENLHMMFYRDIVAAALQGVDPRPPSRRSPRRSSASICPASASRALPARRCRRMRAAEAQERAS
jgi:hypothetical protein